MDAFLAGRIRWTQIAEVCDAALQRHGTAADASASISGTLEVDDIIAADRSARQVASEVLPR